MLEFSDYCGQRLWEHRCEVRESPQGVIEAAILSPSRKCHELRIRMLCLPATTFNCRYMIQRAVEAGT